MMLLNICEENALLGLLKIILCLANSYKLQVLSDGSIFVITLNIIALKFKDFSFLWINFLKSLHKQ